MLADCAQGGLVKTAEAFEFVLVAGLSRANCKAGPILPKHLDLVGFQILYLFWSQVLG